MSGTSRRLTVRPPAVAGAFYPGDARVLERDVRRYLAEADAVDPDLMLRMLIVPHAGYVYSGPVAATGYRLVAEMTGLRRIVMLGPSHYTWFPGLALPGADLLSTPLGTVAVDATAVEVLSRSRHVISSAAAHQREHSLEVQLPFLQIVAPGVPVVPLLTGDIAPADAAAIVEPLLDDETLLLVSSDLSHYHDDATARRLDAVTVRAIERLDPAALDRDSACGRTGIQTALLVARRRGYGVQVLDVRNSSDTAGPPDRVVGYASIALGIPDRARE